ncbi:MAG: type I-E CRISPR-associated protein Cas7/Cse4/CasC [Methanobacteriota archaeon]|nr:MAG: type I-E CRISPR-associated protein Cas7/Cse4/CasC [Euryarchaeota archaeon]
MFVQIHFLTSHHASLLNRDATGQAKRIDFGRVTRTRISSQCQKKHWRDVMREQLSDVPFATRSRLVFNRIAEQIVDEAEKNGMEMDDIHARRLALEIMNLVLTESKSKKKNNKKEEEDSNATEEEKEQKLLEKLTDKQLDTNQPVVFGDPEIKFLSMLAFHVFRVNDGDMKKAVEHIKKSDKLIKDFVAGSDSAPKSVSDDDKNFFKVMRENMAYPVNGVDCAMFGRFINSNIFSRVDAPVHVAHAFTVHEQQSEIDYFSVCDDITMENGESGAAHINEADLNTGVFYGYVSIDVPLLVANLTGCRIDEWKQYAGDDIVRKVLENFMNAVAKVTPGAKLGSTAPYSWAEFIMVEIGEDFPCSMANAFLEPVEKRGDILQEAVKRIEEYRKNMEEIYGKKDNRVLVSTNRNWSGEKTPFAEAVKETVKAIAE